MKIIEIKRKDGTVHDAIAIATFNDGYSHFVEDDGCYLLVNGNSVSSWIFPEAIEVLKTLPSPLDVKRAKINE